MLPFWFEHYGRIADQLLVLVVQEAGDDILPIIALCEGRKAVCAVYETNHFEPDAAVRALKRAVAAERADWVIHADTDEFLHEAAELRQIIAKMEEEKADYAMAWMADRLTLDGTLSPLTGIESVADLHAAFPVRAALTRGLAGGADMKLCLARWPETGQMHGPNGSLKVKGSRRLTLEHFKWWDGLRGRLEKRIRDHEKSGLKWGRESRRILDELDRHGRIRVEKWQVPGGRRAAFPPPPQGAPAVADRVPNAGGGMQIQLSRDLRAVYVLNLARRADRMEAFRKNAAAAGLSGRLEPVRIEAVDGKSFPWFRKGTRPAETATDMGHRYMWALALAHRGPVLLLEDDVTFCRRFRAHLDEPLTLPADCDILQLGMSWLQLHPGQNPVREPKYGWGLFASVLFPSGAAKLLHSEGVNPFRAPDHYSAPGVPGLNIRIVYPMWACIQNQDSDIAPVRAPVSRRIGPHFEDMWESRRAGAPPPVEDAAVGVSALTLRLLGDLSRKYAAGVVLVAGPGATDFAESVFARSPRVCVVEERPRTGEQTAGWSASFPGFTRRQGRGSLALAEAGAPALVVLLNERGLVGADGGGLERWMVELIEAVGGDRLCCVHTVVLPGVKEDEQKAVRELLLRLLPSQRVRCDGTLVVCEPHGLGAA